MPPASLKACPSCGAPRYDVCRRCGWTTAKLRVETGAGRRRMAEILTAWRSQHGDWCPGIGDHRAHDTPDLTVHHLTSDPAGPAVVLCRPVNGALGAPEARL